MRVSHASAMFFLAALSSITFGQTHNPNLAGTQISVQVRYPNSSTGPQGASVMLEGEGAGIVAQGQTDGMGKAMFHPPALGRYVISVRYPGFEPASEHVDMTFSPTAHVTIILKQIPGVVDSTMPPEGPAAGIPGVPPNALKEFEKGQELLKENGDAKGSISHLRKAIELYKPFSQAYMVLGLVYLGQRNWQDAQKTFDQAVHVDPNSAGNHLGLGAAYNGQKNFEAAEKELKRGLEINPHAVEGEYELAKTYWAAGRWEDAQSHTEKALSLRSDFAPAHVLLGNVLLRKGDTNGALRQFKEYLRLDPQGPMAEQTRTLVAKIEKALASAQ